MSRTIPDECNRYGYLRLAALDDFLSSVSGLSSKRIALLEWFSAVNIFITGSDHYSSWTPVDNPVRALFLFLLVLAASPAIAFTPADTVIEARAEVSYFDPELGESVTVYSNLAAFRVAAVAALGLEEDQQQRASPGEQVVFIHRLTHLGNSPDHYQLVLDAPGLERSGIFIYQGTPPAPGDTPVSETPVLEPGEAIDLVIVTRVPSLALTGTQFTISLTAVSQLDNLVKANNTDQVTVASLAVRLLKTVNRTTAKGGEELNYDLELQNTGDLLLPTRDLDVDGQPVTALLLEDLIPPHTRLHPVTAPAVAPVQTTAVVKNLAGHWLRYDRWNHREPVTRIGLLLAPEDFAPGQSARLAFTTIIDDDVRNNTLIVNQATLPLTLTHQDSGAIFYSNEVTTRVDLSDYSGEDDVLIRFVQPRQTQTPFFLSDFTTTSLYYIDPGSPETWQDVYLEVEGGNFSQSPEQLETLEVMVTSDTGDHIRVLLQETGFDTGLFRSQSPLHLSLRGLGRGKLCQAEGALPDFNRPGPNCQLKSRVNDQLLGEITDPVTGKHYETRATVSPTGTVFTSDTLLPLANARVTFTDLLGTGVSSPVTHRGIPDQFTDGTGRFLIPRLPEGHYFIKVIPPGSYHFPSDLPPERFPGKHVGSPSYGDSGPPDAVGRRSAKGGVNILGSFSVFPGQLLEPFDVPIDPVTGATDLILGKTALQPEVAPGETVAYELKLVNRAGQNLYDLQVTDTLPYGFRYLRGSTQIDGQQAADPAGASERQLTFTIHDHPAISEGSELTIGYVLQAGAGAMDGDGINRASAKAHRDISGLSVQSPEARAQVTVKMTGVLSDRATLFGKIYVDANCDGLQSRGEWPIGGVRVYLEDGTWAITDENGQYSLMGLRPGNHVLRVDPLTLLPGLVLKPLDNRHGARGDSRFVDLSPGDMHRADFATHCPGSDSKTMIEQIRARNQSLVNLWPLEDGARFSHSKPGEQIDNRGDRSHGVILGPGENLPPAMGKPADSLHPANSANPAADTTETTTMPVTSNVVNTITRDQALAGTWLWPTGFRADGRFMAVVRTGVQPILYLNGEPVGANHLGEQLVNRREQAQVLAWYGIPLQEGENRLDIRGRDAFGNERTLASGRFSHAGTAERIRITPARATTAADGGRQPVPVQIILLDSQGQPARGVYFVTLDSTAGRWQEPDIQDRQPGHQIRIDQGETTVYWLADNNPGPVTFRATSGELQAETEIIQTTAPRPLFATGLVDLQMGHGHHRNPAVVLENIEDGFSSHGRAAMFIKGEVARDTQLTLAWDSDKDGSTELFRDVDPYDYYPMTGDASVRGYEAQSRSKLYARLEKERNTLLWGDYQTDSRASEQNLARIQRNLNGLSGIYDRDSYWLKGSTRLEGFAARPENDHRTERIQPDGTAMNYRLAGAPVVRHSETLTLETLARDNPGLVLKSQVLSRGRDYVLDDDSGYLRFSAPLLAQDEQGNRQQVRVSYEVTGQGEEYTLAGARLVQQLGDNLQLGLSYTHDGHQDSGSDLSGGWLEYRPDPETTLAFSAGHRRGLPAATDSGNNSKTRGTALRIKARHDWQHRSHHRQEPNNSPGGIPGKNPEKPHTELTWARADPEFRNSASGISAGREETRLLHRQPLTRQLNLRAEAELSRSMEDNGATQGDSLGTFLDYRMADSWQLSAGSRYIRQRSGTAPDRYPTALAALEKRFTLLGREAAISGEYEHALSNPRWRTALVSHWQAHDRVRLYGRFEQDNRLSPVASDLDRNQLALGIDSHWLPHTRTYSEYRMRGATDGAPLEWVNGTDTRLEMVPGLSISPAIEWVNTVSGDPANDGLALSLGLQDKRYLRQRANGRIEYRHGQTRNYYGLDMAVARRLSRDWGGLLREEFRLDAPDDPRQNRTRRQIMTLGLAHRPKLDNRLHSLWLYQWKEEEGGGADNDRRVHLLSTHQNWQISPLQTVSGRLAGKWLTTPMKSFDFRSRTDLADLRWLLDLTPRWDLDLRGGLLAVEGIASRRWSAGAGLHYLMEENLRVGAWYNRVGFVDRDLDSEGYNARGFHFSLQFKFDESLFNWFRL